MTVDQLAELVRVEIERGNGSMMVVLKSRTHVHLPLEHVDFEVKQVDVAVGRHGTWPNEKCLVIG
jgi:hypothetical protein